VPGRYALIVATDAYEDERLRRLRAPAHDAEALARVLRDPEIGGFDVQLLANEPEALLRRRIAAFFSERSRDDLLLLHFSCHGLKDDGGQLFFAASDTEVAQLDASAIPAEFVSRQMARSRSNSVLMLLDCCYSGAIARGLTFRAGDSVDVQDHLGGHGRAIITASSAMEYAFEGDELTGEGQPSVFTSAVVKALATGEADRDQDHWISVRELYDYVCDEVRERTPSQRPNMLSHLEGELFIARSRYVLPVRLPAELTEALRNPLAAVRTGAVGALGELLTGGSAGMASAARARLEEVAAHDDSRRVIAAAEAALAGAERPRAEPPPTTAAVAALAPAEGRAPGAAGRSPVAVARPAQLSGAAWPLVLGAVSVLLILIGWSLPWVYDSTPVDVATDSDLGELWILPVLGAVALVMLGLSVAGRAPEWAWWAVLLVAAWALGVVAYFADFAWTNVWRAGAPVATAGLLGTAGSALALLLREPPRGRRLVPAWAPDALAIAGALVAARILTSGDWPEAESHLRIALTWVNLLAMVAALARRMRAPVVAARAFPALFAAIGAMNAGFAVAVTREGLVIPALALIAAGVYAARQA
jgi:Caspase domain